MLEAVLEALELHVPPPLIAQRDARWAFHDAANPAELRAARSSARSLDLRAAALGGAEAQLVVFPRSRRELPRRHAKLRADLADAVLQRKRGKLEEQLCAARAAYVGGVGGEAVRQIDHRRRSRRGQRAPLAQARQRFAYAPQKLPAGPRCVRAAFEHGEPGARPAERAGYPHE